MRARTPNLRLLGRVPAFVFPAFVYIAAALVLTATHGHHQPAGRATGSSPRSRPDPLGPAQARCQTRGDESHLLFGGQSRSAER